MPMKGSRSDAAATTSSATAGQRSGRPAATATPATGSRRSAARRSWFAASTCAGRLARGARRFRPGAASPSCSSSLAHRVTSRKRERPSASSTTGELHVAPFLGVIEARSAGSPNASSARRFKRSSPGRALEPMWAAPRCAPALCRSHGSASCSGREWMPRWFGGRCRSAVARQCDHELPLDGQQGHPPK